MRTSIWMTMKLKLSLNRVLSSTTSTHVFIHDAHKHKQLSSDYAKLMRITFVM